MKFTPFQAVKELFAEHDIEARYVAGSNPEMPQFRLLKNGKNVGHGHCNGSEVEIGWSGRFKVDLHDPDSILLIKKLIGSSKFGY